MKKIQLVLLTLAAAAGMRAHDPVGGTDNGNAGKLAFTIPNLYGTSGLVLPNPTHFAHFDSGFRNNFAPFNTAMASQLTSLPIPSPASGFTYSFDKDLGVYTRSAQSFGPLLTERAETLGKDKFFFGFTYQRFRFDRFDGLNIRNLPAVFEHSPSAFPDFQKDVITTNNFLDINVGQTTAFFTYGLTDRLDVSVAVPFVATSLSVVSDATIRRIGTGTDDTIHFFETNTGDRSRAQFSNSGTAQGLGDVIVRAKGTLVKTHHFGLAAGLDFRAPTGDEYNFLGSGAPGVKPFVAVSIPGGRFSPHLNVAYQWNGQSVLAGEVLTGQKANLPRQATLAGGVDIGVNSRLTLAVDILSQRVFNAPRVRRTSFTAANGAQFPRVVFIREDLTANSGSVGFKVNGVKNLLVSFNLLFRLDSNGLRGAVTPLIGLSYTF